MVTDRFKADGGPREELANREERVWAALQVELEAFRPSGPGLVTSYLIERARQYRAERSLAELQTQAALAQPKLIRSGPAML